VTDLDAVRQACRPIARWWRAYEHGGYPDPDTLARATTRARLLGPVPGHLGEAIAYVIDGCQDLNYQNAHAAFSRIAAVAEQARTLTLADLDDLSARPPEQLCLAGIPSAPRAATKRRTHRR
jgi:hypothetical protein